MPLDLPRRQLRRLLDEQDLDLLSDRRRCEDLLRRACPGYVPQVQLLLAALDAEIPTDLDAWAGRVPPAKQLTVLTRELEEASYTERWARWAVEAWAFALGHLPEGELTPAPWQGDRPSKTMWVVRPWVGVFVACYLIAYPFIILLLGVYGWAVGSLLGDCLDGAAGKTAGGLAGLTLIAAAFGAARTLRPAARHTWLRGFFVTAAVAAAFALDLTLATAFGPAVLVMMPVVAVFALMALLLAPSHAGAGTAAWLGGLAAALAGGIGLLTGTPLGWAAGGAVGLAGYHGAHGWLQAWGARAEQPRSLLVWPTLRDVLLGGVFGFVAGLLGHVLVAATQAAADGASLTGLTVGLVLGYQLFLWVLFASLLRKGYRKTDAAKVKARGGDLFDKHSGPVRAVAFAPDGGRVLSGGADGGVRLWDVETRRTWRRFPTLGRAGGGDAVLFLPGEGRILAAGPGPTLRLWDEATGKAIDRLHLGGSRPGRLAVALAGDGRTLLIGRFDAGWPHWLFYAGDAFDPRPLRTVRGRGRPLPHAGVHAVAFAPDGRLALSAGKDRTVRLWDVATGAERRRLAGHRDRVNAAAFSPDGRRLATGGEDGTLRVWDVPAGKLLDELPGHLAAVLCVCFSPDGRRLLSGGKDEAIRLWGLGAADERAPPAPEQGAWSAGELERFGGAAGRGIGAVHALAFAPDGRSFVSGSADHSVRVWHIPWESPPADRSAAVHEGVAPFHRRQSVTRPGAPEGGHAV